MRQYTNTGSKDTRSGFGEALLEFGKKNENIVALCADLTASLKMDAFAYAFPDRFYETGIAEANMIGIAAGLTIGGKIPFTGTFANFSTARVFDQIRQSVAYANKNVKMCASHAGITLGEDGATHQSLEDIGMMKLLPNVIVINPCDFNQTRAATFAIAEHIGPVYLRFGRPKVPNFTEPSEPFEIGKALLMNEGSDVSVFATGHLVWHALLAAKALEEKGIHAEVIDIHTIKPLDIATILNSTRKTGCAVSAEEHLRNGGLGDSIAQALIMNHPVPMEIVAVDDKFGESGKPDELMEKFHLHSNDIIAATLRAIDRKKRRQ